MKAASSILIALIVLRAVGLAGEMPQSTPDRDAVVEGNNAFALTLYAQLRRQDGNLFFSPESISTALAMTYAGARGDTAAAMAKTLHFTLPPDRLHPAMGALLGDLNATHQGYQLRVANALWAQQGYKFLDDFLNLMKSDYGAGFNQVDFKSPNDAARLTINQWVELKTENRIKDLLQPGTIDGLTRLVLTNAIYFKGDWQTQFDKSQTRDEDFHVTASQAIKAPLMHREDRFNYFSGGSFQVLEIPYKGRELSLTILLPNGTDGLPALEQSLTTSSLQQWLGKLQPVSNIILAMPRFKTTHQFELKSTLSAMGMQLAFDDDAADFSGMIGKRELVISAVVHKAFVDVNEEGTEAAAATAVIVNRAMAMPRPQQPIVFRADHPFVFLIRENASGAILFMGRVTDPTK